MLRRYAFCIALLALLWTFSHSLARAAESPKFRAGATRIDVTPSPEELPRPYTSVFDHVYARVIVIDNGASRLVLAAVDSATMTGDYPARLAGAIAKVAGTPVENVLLTTTHAHDALQVDATPDATGVPVSNVFNAKVEKALVEGTRQSIAHLQPARIGFARGKARLVANRMQWSPEQARYVLGVDRAGELPTDQTVYVIKFESLAGDPIGLFVSYALMPIVHIARSQSAGGRLGGDVPGATSQYVESALGSNAVVIYAMGSGDQNPLYRADSKRSDAQQASETLVRSYAQILGEEILATAKGVANPADSGQLYGAGKLLTCPGKLTTPINDQNRCSTQPGSSLPLCGVFKEEDAPPVTFGMNLLLIGKIALGSVSEDLATTIIQRMQASSPYTDTMVVSALHGPAHFLDSDDGYGLYTYGSTDSRVKKGCAEQGIIKGFLSLMP